METEESPEETYVHVPGGSDSRANWVELSEYQRMLNPDPLNQGCLVSLLEMIAITGASSYGIYEGVSYFFR